MPVQVQRHSHILVFCVPFVPQAYQLAVTPTKTSSQPYGDAGIGEAPAAAGSGRRPGEGFFSDKGQRIKALLKDKSAGLREKLGGGRNSPALPATQQSEESFIDLDSEGTPSNKQGRKASSSVLAYRAGDGSVDDCIAYNKPEIIYSIISGLSSRIMTGFPAVKAFAVQSIICAGGEGTAVDPFADLEAACSLDCRASDCVTPALTAAASSSAVRQSSGDWIHVTEPGMHRRNAE